VYRPGSPPQAALVVGGLIRVYLTSRGGRQVTVRYARPGDVLGIAVLIGGPVGTGVQAVEPSSLFRIGGRMLTAAARRDPRVCWAIAEELNRRLYEVPEQTAVNAFGSVRQRVAAHLLDLASTGQRPDRRLVPACRSRSWPMRPGRSARWWPACCASSGLRESWPPQQTKW
jgi:CRP/FNR family cyclic AMP-dependent transcriptional regulator